MKLICLILILSFSVHANVRYLGDAFDNVRANWSVDLQGMCHDEEYYYITQTEAIWKIPRSRKIESVNSVYTENAVAKYSIPTDLAKQGSNHMGDCDVHNGIIYIPLEGTKPQKLLLLKTGTLEFISAPKLSIKQTHAPWVTVDARSGHIYSGNFDIPGRQGIIQYKLSKNKQKLIPIRRMHFRDGKGRLMSLKRVQGAEIVRSRNVFWFVSDLEEGGLYGFSLKSGRLIYYKRIRYSRNFPKYEELEGIDALERGEMDFPNYAGNLFVCMLDNNLFHDYAFLKHFEY